MEILIFTLTVAAILMLPGPTNVLLLNRARVEGLTRALRLIPAEVAGYLLAVLMCRLVGTAMITVFPQTVPLLQCVLVIYLLWLASKIWRVGSPALVTSKVPITSCRVFVTTLLNPKAAIFAFVVFPTVSTNVSIVTYGLAFASTIALVGLGWIFLGHSLKFFQNTVSEKTVSRFTAGTLVAFALVAAGSIVSRNAHW